MSTIDQDVLIRELQPVTAWPEIGCYLGIDKPTIEEIRKKNADDEQCKIKLVQYWAVKNPDGTMVDIIHAVENVGNIDLAARLKNKYYRGTQDDHEGSERLTKFCSLEKKFILLVVHAKEEFRYGQFQEVKSRLKNTFTESDLSSFASFDQLFGFLLQKHLNEFNTYALEVVADLLPRKVQDEYKLFLDAQNDFYRSVSVHQFEVACLCHREYKCPKDMTAIAIKLPTSNAQAISMKELQEFVQSIFREKARYLGQVVATRGCISVSWLISLSLVSELCKTAESQTYPDWIQQVKIGSSVVFSKASEYPEEDQEEDQYSNKELRRQLQENIVQLEQSKMQMCELKMEMERLKKEPSDPILDMMQEWTDSKDNFEAAKHMFHVIEQQPQNKIVESAKKICKVLQKPQPIILIPVTGPQKSGKTVLLNAMLGGSIVHKKKAFPIYVEHVAERHLHCEADTPPCDSCARLVTSSGDVLAIGRSNILYQQENLKKPENGKYYIIQTKILMLDKIPNDFPFTVYLADCPANNIAQIQHDFALPTLIVPAVVCAVSTRDYIGDHEGTLTSAKQALGLTMGLSEAQVVFAATFCDEVYGGGDQLKSMVPRMRVDLGNLSTNPYAYYAVAGKWALKAREYIDDPHKEGLDGYMKAAWKWVQTEENVPKWINPDKIVELAIGYFEKRIKQSITEIKVKQWVDRFYFHAQSNMLDDV